jgi:hypothetical protein
MIERGSEGGKDIKRFKENKKRKKLNMKKY